MVGIVSGTFCRQSMCSTAPTGDRGGGYCPLCFLGIRAEGAAVSCQLSMGRHSWWVYLLANVYIRGWRAGGRRTGDEWLPVPQGIGDRLNCLGSFSPPPPPIVLSCHSLITPGLKMGSFCHGVGWKWGWSPSVMFTDQAFHGILEESLLSLHSQPCRRRGDFSIFAK